MLKQIALCCALVACSSKKADKAEPAHHEATEHHEMENMPPELAKFHDVLAPHWHADKNDKRMPETCAAIGDFHAQADAVAKAAPPAGAKADTWAAGTKQLGDAVAGLDASCKGTDAAAFDAAFTKVHQSFHALLEAGGGEHAM